MDLRYYCEYKIWMFIAVFVGIVCTSCSSSQETANSHIPAEDLPNILREVANAPADTIQENRNEPVTLNYANKSTSISIPIDPKEQEFVLELKGLKKENEEPEDTTENALQDSLNQEEMAKKIKQVLKDFRKAQDLFYREDYKGALERINQSLETQETADALGLKGTIFFMRDNMSSAKYYWNRAVDMDPDIVLPDIPEVRSMIEQIKATEDQEEAEE